MRAPHIIMCSFTVIFLWGMGELSTLANKTGIPIAWQSLHGTQPEDGLFTVQGDGSNNLAWLSEPIEAKSGAYYEFSFWGRKTANTQGGLAVSGPTFANRDFTFGNEFQPYSFVFRVPDNQHQIQLRMGQWHVDGALQFKKPQLVPVQPIYTTNPPYTLGHGEHLGGDSYTASHEMNAKGANACRFLHSTNARFNSNRWLITADSAIEYRHQLPNPFISANVHINVNYHVRGQCVVEAKNARSAKWTPLGSLDEVNGGEWKIPSALFPAKEIRVRLRGEAINNRCSLQVNQYHFQARVDGDLPNLQGDTHYIRVIQSKPGWNVQVLDIGDPKPGIETALKVNLEGPRNREGQMKLTCVSAEDKFTKEGKIPLNKITSIPYTVRHAGANRFQLAVFDQKQEVQRIEFSTNVSYLHQIDYGASLFTHNHINLWWCPSTYKISKTRPVPDKKGEIHLSAAKGEYQSVQLVFQANEELDDSIKFEIPNTLFNKQGEPIENGIQMDVHEVDYVYIQHPTDDIGSKDWWPDPLPPCDGLQIKKPRRNYPLWITIYIPRSLHADAYQYYLHLKNGSETISLPLNIRVFDFALPQTFSLRTAFGFNPGLLKKYHNLETKSELKEVTDLYYQNFREHRISPYNPTSLDPIQYELDDGFTFDFTQFDKAGERYFDEFGFTTLRLPLVGMGGGTFHSRHKGRIGKHEQGTREYERLFHQYASTIEAHLRKKGWLDKAFVYWFDEPQEKDYAFVKEGMELIHRHAPGLDRFLTEEPIKELHNWVEIWCPVLHNFEEASAKERQKAGDEIWWYVCTGPKEPYPGLFIDHHAIEMRMWLWMTYKYNVQGCLVWASNYWTSNAAFPGPKIQNPWDDPMSYVSGYSKPAGFIGYWGNGDGRFLYPPKNWQSGERLMQGPVNSFRWEMLRDGIEDYEYFQAVKQVVREGNLSDREKTYAERELLTIPDAIIHSRTEFTKDPKLLDERRNKIGEFLSKIKKKSAVQ